MTRTTESSNSTTRVVLLVGTLACACLAFICFMLYRSEQRARGERMQATTECIDRSVKGYGPGMDICIERAKAAAGHPSAR